jgi:hypothetical protein
MEITAEQQHMLNRVCELTRELIEARPQDAKQYDDAKLVEYAFEEAVLKMQEELILSDPNKVRELQEQEANAEKACDAHEQEAKRRKAEFYNFGWVGGHFDESDWFTITSKTSRGKFSTSSHVKTGKVQHCWHD